MRVPIASRGAAGRCSATGAGSNAYDALSTPMVDISPPEPGCSGTEAVMALAQANLRVTVDGPASGGRSLDSCATIRAGRTQICAEGDAFGIRSSARLRRVVEIRRPGSVSLTGGAAAARA